MICDCVVLGSVAVLAVLVGYYCALLVGRLV